MKVKRSLNFDGLQVGEFVVLHEPLEVNGMALVGRWTNSRRVPCCGGHEE